MSTYYTHHPKRAKNCVFCKYWIGDAEKQFINSIVGYKYSGTAPLLRPAIPVRTMRPAKTQKGYCKEEVYAAFTNCARPFGRVY